MKPGTREWNEAIWAAGAAGELPDWADVAWYAADAAGNIGFFTAAGIGPIPRAVFRDLDTYDRLVAHMRALPAVGASTLRMRFPNTKEWRRAAGQGCFAFDFREGEGYRLVAHPSVPLHLESLPEWVQAQLTDARIHRESFSEAAERTVNLSRVESGLVSL